MKFILVSLLLVSVHSQYCRTISLEGGGSHGAYEAGAIWTMVNTLSAQDVAYDIVSGISTGALNTGAMAQFAVGDEKNMANFLIDTWSTIGGSDNVFVQWPGGLAQGILFETGLYDTSPLRKMINTKFTKGIHRKFTVGATNLNTAGFDNFEENVGNSLNEVVMCSASPPFIFPFQLYNNQVYSDGGCLINLDVVAAINRCYAQTNNYANIIVDLIFDTKIDAIPASTSFNTIDVFSRVSQVTTYNSALWFYNEAIVAYPQVNYRYCVIPSGPMPGGIVPLNFTQSILLQEIQMGKSDAANVVKSPGSCKEVLSKLFAEMRSRIIIP